MNPNFPDGLLKGLYIGVSPEVNTGDDLPQHAIILANILKQPGIKFQIAPKAGLAKDAFQLDVGAKWAD